MWASLAVRQALARKPKWRMRRKPRGRTCSRNRRMNSPASSGHRFALVAGAVVLPAEADAPILAREQTAVGEGDPVRVAAEIVENLPGPAERSLGIDDPFDAAQRLDVRTESGRLAQPREIAEEGQVASLKGRLETLEEEAAIKTREDADGQEEARAAGDEASVRPDAAPRHDAVDVRVVGERLPPRVQDRDHPGLGAQMLRIGADGADGLGRGLEQDVVDHGLVLQGDRRHRRRQGEDDMKIGDGQEFGPAIGQPLQPRETLALRAVPVAAGVIGDADLATSIALLDMTAERCRAARLDGGHDPPLDARQPIALRSPERLAVAAEDIRHLQRGTHGLVTRAGPPRGTGGRRGSACRRSGLWRPAHNGPSTPARRARAGPG